jgi:phospholipase/carboxylesterase
LTVVIGLCFGCDEERARPAQGSGDRAASGAHAAQPAAVTRLPAERAAPSAGARREPALRQAGELVYLEMITGGAAEDARLPLVVAIHGLGDKPQQFAGMFFGFDVPARIALPRGPDAYGDGYSWFAFRAGGDVSRVSAGIERAAAKLAVAIADIVGRRPTAGSPIVTGFSQGGMLSFALAVHHPDMVGSAVPIGGWLPPPLWPTAPAPEGAPKIVALHGSDDSLVPIAPTRDAVQALRERGYDATLETFEGVRHTVPSVMRGKLFDELERAIGRR